MHVLPPICYSLPITYRVQQSTSTIGYNLNLPAIKPKPIGPSPERRGPLSLPPLLPGGKFSSNKSHIRKSVACSTNSSTMSPRDCIAQNFGKNFSNLFYVKNMFVTCSVDL
ncbi:hypothetical protein GQX74_003552 [Glossina fuscipes]|nr:hypothetical protein GQX74_003552 [Glossina fuscipes]